MHKRRRCPDAHQRHGLRPLVARCRTVQCFCSQRPASMRIRRLGRTAVEVPIICFGTMLFGESTDERTAHQLLNQCWDAGVNFFDSAEMYPVPQRADTSGESERILGRWMKSKPRDQVLVSTKVCGPSGQMVWIRGGPHRVDSENITQAIHGSLQRLQTDYIDILHIHWPDRYVPMFGDVDYDPHMAYTAVPIEEQLEALGQAQREGKVRYVALSNETPYGLTYALMAGKGPGCVLGAVLGHSYDEALQNALSLTCRTFDSGLAEVCHQEGVSLLAYSPLAMGWLTGKYLEPGGGPSEARLNKYKNRYAEAESRYGPRPSLVSAVREYCDLARDAGMTPTQMALRWVLQHPLVTSAVIGATSSAQLAEQLTAAEQPSLPQDLLEAIDRVHSRFPNPTP